MIGGTPAGDSAPAGFSGARKRPATEVTDPVTRGFCGTAARLGSRPPRAPCRLGRIEERVEPPAFRGVEGRFVLPLGRAA